MIFPITLYSLLFTFITWHRFTYGVFLLFLLLPTYLIRFSIPPLDGTPSSFAGGVGPLPSTLLEIMILIVFLIGLVKYRTHIKKTATELFQTHTLLSVGTLLFLLAATISIFTSVDIRTAAGEWKAFYVEPVVLIFTLFVAFTAESKNSKEKQFPISNLQSPIIYGLILSGLITSLLAIFQHFTGWMVPWAFWENGNSYRVTGWYGFPNGVGLFVSPLVILAISGILEYIKRIQGHTKNGDWRLETCLPAGKVGDSLYLVSCILLVLLGPLAVFYAKSTGGLVGILAGIGILLVWYKKTRWPAVILGIIAFTSLMLVPNLSGIKQEVLLQDRSGQIRVHMWRETIELLKDTPIRGAGIASYDERIAPYHQLVHGERIEIFHHPHNIFLTMYVNLGLLGLIGFLLIVLGFVKGAVSNLACRQAGLQSPVSEKSFSPTVSPIILLSTLCVILTMGLVDSPYVKNDLAVLFWVVPLLLLISSYANLENEKT